MKTDNIVDTLSQNLRKEVPGFFDALGGTREDRPDTEISFYNDVEVKVDGSKVALVQIDVSTIKWN